MRINVIRLRRQEDSDRVSKRVFVVEADTLEALATAVNALDELDPLGDPDTQRTETSDE